MQVRAGGRGLFPTGPRRLLRAGAIGFLSLAAWLPSTLAAQDDGFDLFDLRYARGYVSFGFGTGFPAATFVDAVTLAGTAEFYDMTLGADLGRYTGAELGLSYVEFDVREPSLGKISELTLSSFIPQLRLRLPIARDRLVPWVAGGVGLASLVVNDRTLAGRDIVDSGVELHAALSVGGGVDYFLAPNLSVGLMTKYQRTSLDVTSFGEQIPAVGAALSLAGFLRLHVPETPPARAFPGVRWHPPDPDGLRPYFLFRFGLRDYLHTAFTDGTIISSEDGAEQTSSIAFGLDLNRRVGLELVGEAHEIPIWTDTQKLVEFASWVVAPQVRARFPAFGDRFVPYANGGLGVGWTRTNDARPIENLDPTMRLTRGGTTLVPMIGGGGDYGLASNLAAIIDLRYIHHPSSILVGGEPVSVDLSSIQLSGGFRFYLR